MKNLRQEHTVSNVAARIVRYRESKQFVTSIENAEEKFMLTNTELCEAIEEHRRGFIEDSDGVCYGDAWDQFKVEVADAMIRWLDLAYSIGFDLEVGYSVQFPTYRTIRPSNIIAFNLDSIPYRLFDIVKAIVSSSHSLRNWQGSENELVKANAWASFGGSLANVASLIIALSNDMGFSLADEINKKMVVNEARPIRHGKRY